MIPNMRSSDDAVKYIVKDAVGHLCSLQHELMQIGYSPNFSGTLELTSTKRLTFEPGSVVVGRWLAGLISGIAFSTIMIAMAAHAGCAWRRRLPSSTAQDAADHELEPLLQV
mmetsp:Transcript_178830/g.573121  ORF Transcript_178830/g.573121 Transcript_178830/m.573121 type:complete len:112 (+) Transcript_178830:724-1059(+)